MTEQQTPASVVERLFLTSTMPGSLAREAASLIERLSAEREGLAERLEVAAVHLQLAGGWLREAGDDGQRANTLLKASNEARAALTQGESRQTGGWQDIATGAKAVIRDGKIVISIDVDALPVIVSGSCASNGLRGLWSVTDADVFAKEVCHSLNDEKEDGTTRVHLMFDSAFNHAIEQGGEGIETVTEAEFEAECSRFHALPPAPTDTGRE